MGSGAAAGVASAVVSCSDGSKDAEISRELEATGETTESRYSLRLRRRASSAKALVVLHGDRSRCMAANCAGLRACGSDACKLASKSGSLVFGSLASLVGAFASRSVLGARSAPRSVGAAAAADEIAGASPLVYPESIDAAHASAGSCFGEKAAADAPSAAGCGASAMMREREWLSVTWYAFLSPTNAGGWTPRSVPGRFPRVAGGRSSRPGASGGPFCRGTRRLHRPS